MSPPTMRESSNEQDAPETTGETAVQGRPSRSILKRLRVEHVRPSIVRPLMVEHHYLQSMPAAPRRCYGIYLDGALLGGVVFTSGARQGHRLLAAANPQDVATLARLWLSDDLPANSESRVLGVVLRDLRRTTSWKLLLSYADPAAGHVGTIYQATGWVYLGETAGETYVRLVDGQLHHPRSVFTHFGSNRIGHLNATGVAARREFVGGKHRYAYVLDPAWGWRLRDLRQSYPAPQSRSGLSPPSAIQAPRRLPTKSGSSRPRSGSSRWFPYSATPRLGSGGRSGSVSATPPGRTRTCSCSCSGSLFPILKCRRTTGRVRRSRLGCGN